MNFIFIQARMGSTRLPGKVLKPLAGKSQLQHLVDRLGNYRKDITIVTSGLPADKPIEEFCALNKINCFRGSETDVLDRFYRAALNAGVKENDAIVRLTADCPLHHEDVIKFALEEFEKHNLDYFSNSFSPVYEDGCDTEVFRFRVLAVAQREARLASQHEHVTPFIKDSGIFLCGYKKYDPRFHFKLSVDTIEDHATVDNIFAAFSPRTDFTVHEIVDLLEKNAERILVNKKSVINSGYAKSLENDKEIK